jgi:hypothetical protein
MSENSLPKTVYSLEPYIVKKLTSASYESVEKAVKAFVRQSALRLKAGCWMNEERPTKQYLMGDVGDFKILEDVRASSLFTPFVEKHIISSKAKIAVIGDIHGDIETLVVTLEKLRQEGYLDKNYHIIVQDFYIIFIGDYTNRMPFSVEVMMLLYHVYEYNLGHVFLLRGNHEYAASNREFYDQYDYINNTNDVEGIETLLGEFARKFGIYYYPDLLYWYDYLPLTCYLGCKKGEKEVVNFIQFCHSGLEIGFNPQKFLSCNGVKFNKISHINRCDVIRKILLDKRFQGLHDKIKNSFESIKKTHLKEMVKSYTDFEKIGLNDPKNLNDIKFGSLWNGFIVEENDSGFEASLSHSNIQFGKHLTEYFMNLFSNSSAKILSIVRGNQDINGQENPKEICCGMLSNIIKGRGCARQWDGMLYTLGDSGRLSGYQSFLILSLATDVDLWKISHFSKKRKESSFSERVGNFLG